MDTLEIRKLNELKVSNPYLRMGSDVSELEKSIETIGLIAPLVISEDNTVLAGGRRYQALLNLGHTEAPVVIVRKGELEKELISIDENLVRKDLNKIEIEEHLRRAKEIYQELNPHESFEDLDQIEKSFKEKDHNETSVEESSDEDTPKKTILPAEKFFKMVSDKTGLSPRQIHQAISRDEKAAPEIKEARKKGELSISQTNEIVKLSPEEQPKAFMHLKGRPVREIKKFIKLAKGQGVDQAIQQTPEQPHAREFREIESTLKKLVKQLKQLDIEGIRPEDFPKDTKDLFDYILSEYFSSPSLSERSFDQSAEGREESASFQ